MKSDVKYIVLHEDVRRSHGKHAYVVWAMNYGFMSDPAYETNDRADALMWAMLHGELVTAPRADDSLEDYETVVMP